MSPVINARLLGARMPSEPTPLEEVSHLTLQVGRILFQNNADTAEVEDSVRRFASAFGCETHLLVTYETLLLTLISNQQFRTKAGNLFSAMNVNMAAVAAVKALVADVEAGGPMRLEEIRRKLDEIECQPPILQAVDCCRWSQSHRGKSRPIIRW